MEDHIFGTYSTDALKLLHTRVAASGIQHGARIEPLDPIPEAPVRLYVATGGDFPADRVVCYYTTDGSEPRGAMGQATQGHAVDFEPLESVWNTIAWDYQTRWAVTLPPQPDGTIVRYRIGGWLTAVGEERWADSPSPQKAIELALSEGHSDELPPAARNLGGSDFAFGVDRWTAPRWAREAVIYQVFIDRFDPGPGGEWNSVNGLMDIHGGTLRGVIARLDTLAELGVTCLWLSPLFPSPSHHGYDATDYFSIEPRMGSLDDFRELVEAAHARGMRILLDFICNHVSNEHPAFQAAAADPASPYRPWFTFDEIYQPLGYRAFFGVATMPELNTDFPGARNYLIEAATYWLREFDVDGFRLDYANGPSHAFWTEFWHAVKQTKADAWCFGEVVDTPQAQLTYSGRLDGVLDFHLGDALRRVFAARSRDLAWFNAFIGQHRRFFGQALTLPVFLDNHDMDRFLWAAGGDLRRLKVGAAVMLALPNPPIIYYGTEIGLSQRGSKNDGWGLEISREPMPWTWDDQAQAMWHYFQALLKVRSSLHALRGDVRLTLHVGPDEWLVSCRSSGSEVLVAVNRADTPARLPVPGEYARRWRDLISGEIVDGSERFLPLGPVEARWLVTA